MANDGGGSPTANQKALDRTVLHGIFVARFTNGLAARIDRFFRTEVVSDIAARVRDRMTAIEERGEDLGPATTARLRRLNALNTDTIFGGFESIRKDVESTLVDFAKAEASFERRTLELSIPKAFLTRAKIEFEKPTAALLRTLVESKPFEGNVLADWFSGLAIDTQKHLDRSIRVGMAEGETSDQIVNRILRGNENTGEGTFARTRRNAESIVRTAVNHVSNDARFAVTKENADLMDGWRFVATLDTSTTVICAAHDGKVYSIDDVANRPPLHWGCRSTTVNVFKSWRRFGFDFDELPSSTRASMSGQVPQKENYDAWLRRQPESTQNLILGEGKAKIFRGGTKIDRFVNDRNRPLTLDELKALSEA
mgnify:CR=1 FL=1